jgi:hypothetical protein
MTKHCGNCQWFTYHSGQDICLCSEPRRLAPIDSVGLGGASVITMQPITTSPQHVCDFHAEPVPDNFRMEKVTLGGQPVPTS